MIKHDFFISQIWHNLNVRRKFKDRLFQRVFSDKKYMLELYNALNHTCYNNPNDLEITTLEDVIYLSMKNDLSFMISSTLNLYEHQSSCNPNMPIRGLLYFSRMYEAYIKQHHLNMYGNSRLKLPTPEYIVFYNGNDPMEDETEYRLTDSFEANSYGHKPALECTVRQLNINYGHNEELMNACKRLHDYSFFIDQVKIRLDKGYKLKYAIKEAMDYCIEENILVDVLEKQQSEVVSMLLTEFNERQYKKMLRKEAREEGLEEGRTGGLIIGKAEGRLVGRLEGRLEINQLYQKLNEAGRTDDILESVIYFV